MWVEGLEQFLADPRLDIEHVGQQVGQAAGILLVHGSDEGVVGQVWVKCDDLFEKRQHRAHERFGRHVVTLVLVNRDAADAEIGCVSINSTRRTRSMPCTRTVVEPSGIRSTRPISTAVPIWYRSARSRSGPAPRHARGGRRRGAAFRWPLRLPRPSTFDRARGTGVSPGSGRPRSQAAPGRGTRSPRGIQVLDARAPGLALPPRFTPGEHVQERPRRPHVGSLSVGPPPLSSILLSKDPSLLNPAPVSPAVSSCHTQSSAANASGCRCAHSRRACATTKIEPVTQIRSCGSAQASASRSAAARSGCTLIGGGC